MEPGRGSREAGAARHPAEDVGGELTEVRPRRDRAAGVYVHIPFCRRLCPYCDFAVVVRREIPHRAYADALVRELKERVVELQGRSVRTIYFGGGTPSALDVTELERVVDALREVLDVGDLVEVTLEANPLDVTWERLEAWRAVGISRLSLGVQSFDDAYLSRLGRDHDGATARDAVRHALDNPLQVNVDLIFAGPAHDEAVLERDLEIVGELRPHHVSAYQLTVEEGTVFARRAARGELPLPEEGEVEGLFDAMSQRLGQMELHRYEVSNYARPGHESRHNTGYWSGWEYLGLGVGAHSLRVDGEVQRRANTRSLERYLTGGAAAIEEVETLDARTHLLERVILALRTRAGAELEELTWQFPELDVARYVDRLAPLVSAGMVDVSEGKIRPTERGLDLGNSVASWIWTTLS